MSGRVTVTLYVSVPCADCTFTSISVPLSGPGPSVALFSGTCAASTVFPPTWTVTPVTPEPCVATTATSLVNGETSVAV